MPGAGARFLTLVLLFALVTVVAINVVMTQVLDEGFSFWDWVTSIGTALIVGTFAGLLVMAGRRRGHPAPDGPPPDDGSSGTEAAPPGAADRGATDEGPAGPDEGFRIEKRND